MESSSLGPFEVAGRLGRGGMGEVWAGRHAKLGQAVAIKVITAKLVDRPRLRAAFTDEVRAVARLRHEGIVQVLDYGTVPEGTPLPAGSPFLVMARADGTVRDQERWGWSDVRSLLLEVLDGLAHAHAHGVIHLDLKPGNLLRVGGRTAISDFGIAAFQGQDLGREAFRGSAAYMAPEQFSGRWRDFGPSTDLYALGTVAWELLCGEVPFVSTDPTTLGNLKRSSAPPTLPDSVAPAELRAWFEGMLATEPSDRYARAADAAYALRQIPADAPVELGEVGRRRAQETIALSTLGAEATWDPDEMPSLRPLAAIRPRRAPLQARWRSSSARPELLKEALGLGLFELRPPPFVGRECEREALWSGLLESWTDERPHVAIVEGPQGVGATRLVEWIARRADEVGNAIAVVADAQESPRALWRRMLLLEGLDADGVVQQLVTGRVRLDETLAHAVSAWLEPGASMRRQDTAALQVALVEHLAATRPVVLVLDRAPPDDERWDLARAILRCRGPISALLTVRSDERVRDPQLDRRVAALEAAGAVTLAIEPLPYGRMRVLVERVLRLEGGLVATLVERSDGNPRRMLETLGRWRDEGWLVPGASGFTLDPQADPATVSGSTWLPRVADLLEGPDALGLELAAVFGDPVDREVWARMLDDWAAERVLALEEILVRRGLVRPRPGGFVFSHPDLPAEIRQALGDRRIAHHRHIAEVLRPLGDAWRVRRGNQLYEGELWADALEEIVASIGPLWNSMHVNAARAAALRARRAAGKLGDPGDQPAFLAAIEAFYAMHAGRFDEASALIEPLIAEAEATGNERLLGRTLRVRGSMLQRQGDLPAAAEDLARSADLLTRSGEDWMACSVRVLWMHTLLQLGRYQEARDLIGTLDPSIPGNVVEVEGVKGILCTYEEEWSASIVHFEEAARVARLNGLGVAEAGVLANLSESYRFQGDLVRASMHLERSIELARRLGMAGESVLRLNRAQLLLDVGEVDTAWSELEIAQAGLERMGRIGLLGASHVVALRCLSMRGDWDSWDRHFERSEALLAGTGMVEPELAEAYEKAAELAREAGHVAYADAALERARAQRDALSS